MGASPQGELSLPFWLWEWLWIWEGGILGTLFGNASEGPREVNWSWRERRLWPGRLTPSKKSEFITLGDPKAFLLQGLAH